ncbi:hypothetical protein BJY14_007918 [Actinomadura luteofluorescens]|uniref:Uncharacterized protein n=1 Tax=Actinomadura luteofluorescens TaxID=46163 RepID=A0A7Y9ERS6_9ACTN|nr:hypothetical protein [Actinomadura luteofluorescens]
MTYPASGISGPLAFRGRGAVGRSLLR